MPAEHLGQIERRPQIRAQLKGCACVHVGFYWHTRTMSPRGKASTRPPTTARSPRQRCQRDRWSALTTRSGSTSPWCTARAPWCEQLGRSSPQGKSRRTRRSFATQRRPTRPCQQRNRTDNPFPSVPEGAPACCSQSAQPTHQCLCVQRIESQAVSTRVALIEHATRLDSTGTAILHCWRVSR